MAKPKTQAEIAVGRDDVAPSQPIPEDPSSILSNTSPVLDEVNALGDKELALVNLYEVEKRVGLLSRIVLEYALRSSGRMSLRDKADIALRAISVLEGTKQTVEWKEDMRRKPTPKSVEALEKEMKEREARVTKMLIRRKEIQVKEAEAALKAIGEKKDEEDDGDSEGNKELN